MISRHRRLLSRLVGIAAAVLVFSAVFAQDFPANDTREIQGYELTEAGLAKYTQATRNLDALGTNPSTGCDDDGASATSLDNMVARLDAVPGVKSAIKSAGMTTREYLLFTWSVFQNGMAAWALDQPGAKPSPGVSMANVDFYRQHEAEFKKLGKSGMSGDCDQQDDSTDETED